MLPQATEAAAGVAHVEEPSVLMLWRKLVPEQVLLLMPPKLPDAGFGSWAALNRPEESPAYPWVAFLFATFSGVNPRLACFPFKAV